jgi:hypothetical protein
MTGGAQDVVVDMPMGFDRDRDSVTLQGKSVNDG